MKLKLKEIKTVIEIDELFAVVERIWPEVFTPVIGQEQVDYMLKNYQSPANIAEEINQGAHYYLLDFEGRHVGYTAFEENEGEIYLSKIYLDQSVRGQGLASELFAWYDQKARGKKLRLNVNQGNRRAIEVYEHRGFHRVGERYAEIGEGFVMNDFIYEKNCR